MPEERFAGLGLKIYFDSILKNIFYHDDINVTKIAITICLMSLVLAEIIAYLNPQTGYELSFYSSTPSVIFALIGLTIVGGICIMCQQVLSGNYRHSKIWVGGFALLLLTRLVFLYLPWIRGYYTWMGDNSSHIGALKSLIETGHVEPGNFYPATHIILNQVTLITALPVEFVGNHSTAVISILYIIGIYLLARIAFDDDKPVILSITAVACVIGAYDVALMPNGWSCLYLPIAIYLIIRSLGKEQRFSFKILALIAIVLYPFFHPLSAFLLFMIIITFMAYLNFNIDSFLRFFSRRSISVKLPPYPRHINSNLFLVGIVGIGAIVWTMWVLSFVWFDNNIRSFFNAMIFGDTKDYVGLMMDKAGKMEFNLIDLLILLIKAYGDELIFVLTFLFGIFIFIRYRKSFPKADNLVLISIATIFFGLLYLVFIAGVPGLDSINAQRVQYFVVLFIPIFSGIFFSYALSLKNTSVTCLCILLLVAPPILTLFAAIPSPYIHRDTPDVSEMDLKGMGWTFQNKDTKLPIGYITSRPFRYADLVLGRAGRESRSDVDRYADQFPNHFNYHQNRYAGETFTNNTYGVMTKLDTVLYETVYQKVGRYRSADFDRLQIDSTVNRVYCNDECTVYIFQAVG